MWRACPCEDLGEVPIYLNEVFVVAALNTKPRAMKIRQKKKKGGMSIHNKTILPITSDTNEC